MSFWMELLGSRFNFRLFTRLFMAMTICLSEQPHAKVQYVQFHDTSAINNRPPKDIANAVHTAIGKRTHRKNFKLCGLCLPGHLASTCFLSYINKNEYGH
jgi:hypothetical protein